MGATFNLVVPDEKGVHHIVRRYYDFYLDRMDTYVEADTVEELSDYQWSMDRLAEHGDPFVYQQLVSSVSERLARPPFDIYDEYAVESVLWDQDGLLELRSLFAEVRDGAGDQEIPEHVDRQIEELLTLIEFAIENDCGISYP